MPEIILSVNGGEHKVEVMDDTPLLWVLRDNLNLTGTKYSCGEGYCGACTVLLDGKPVRSCVLSAVNAVGKEITTIEGLSPDGTHPVQAAWAAENVTQCGYCQPGQILTAVSLLEKNPNPNDAEIDQAMGNVLCRCGTYQRIKRAIQRAAKGEL